MSAQLTQETLRAAFHALVDVCLASLDDGRLFTAKAEAKQLVEIASFMTDPFFTEAASSWVDITEERVKEASQ